VCVLVRECVGRREGKVCVGGKGGKCVFTFFLSSYLFSFYFPSRYYRKDVSEILEIFDNTTVHSLNLRQQQKVEEELQIIKKKIKKGIFYFPLVMIRQ
jgi:hypothetical protein